MPLRICDLRLGLTVCVQPACIRSSPESCRLDATTTDLHSCISDNKNVSMQRVRGRVSSVPSLAFWSPAPMSRSSLWTCTSPAVSGVCLLMRQHLVNASGQCSTKRVAVDRLSGTASSISPYAHPSMIPWSPGLTSSSSVLACAPTVTSELWLASSRNPTNLAAQAVAVPLLNVNSRVNIDVLQCTPHDRLGGHQVQQQSSHVALQTYLTSSRIVWDAWAADLVSLETFPMKRSGRLLAAVNLESQVVAVFFSNRGAYSLATASSNHFRVCCESRCFLSF